MTKAAKKKAAGKVIMKRVAKQAIAESFGEKAAKVTEEPKAVAGKPYMIFVDAQAVAYLRVAKDTVRDYENKKNVKGDDYIMNTGVKSVDVVFLPKATAKSRGLQEVPEASIIDAAKVLAKPLSSGIIVSERAQKYLNEILADKELIEMANKKAAAKTAKKSATKSTAQAKSGARSSADAIVVFKKSPKEGELPPQAAQIVALVQKAGELSVAKLLEKMDGVVKTKQTMQTIFSFYKTKLTGGGFLVVKAAA